MATYLQQQEPNLHEETHIGGPGDDCLTIANVHNTFFFWFPSWNTVNFCLVLVAGENMRKVHVSAKQGLSLLLSQDTLHRMKSYPIFS